MLDLHTGAHGYTEVNPPLLVTRRRHVRHGQLPKFARRPVRDRARCHAAEICEQIRVKAVDMAVKELNSPPPSCRSTIMVFEDAGDRARICRRMRAAGSFPPPRCR